MFYCRCNTDFGWKGIPYPGSADVESPCLTVRDLGTTRVLLLEDRRDALPGIADVLVKSSVRY